ncbi:MAG TPA: hypothetical protein VIM02_14135 [Rhizomicrobium sp.]|jgi:hypothetical protein
MKTILLLTAAAVLASTGGAMADPTTISFDGYCDVWTITPSDRPLVAAVENDPDGTCETFRGIGDLGRIRGFGHAVSIGGVFNSGDPNAVYVTTISEPLVTGGTFSVYYTLDGVTVNLSHTGTYTVVAAGSKVERGHKRLTEKAHR